jgi:hypothetical protein
MTQLITDLAFLILVLTMTGLMLFGWGCLAWVCLGLNRPKQQDTLTIWLGFCLVLSVLEFIQLFVAIDWRVSTLMTGLGLLALVRQRINPLRTWRSSVVALANYYPWQSLIILIVVLLWCLRAMGEPNNYDSGLYHFQSIRWLNEEPIALGLGNLHWRLALNQAYFGFLALLNLAPVWGKGYAAGGLFLLLLTLVTLIQALPIRASGSIPVAVTAQERLALPAASLGAVLFVFMGMVASSVVNPSPDNAVSLLEIGIFVLLGGFVQRFWSQVNTGHCLQEAAVIVFMCLAAVLSKFSALGFVLGALLAMSVLMIRAKIFKGLVTWRIIVTLLSCLGIHVVRGYLSSGAPFFPASLFGAWQLPWAVPVEVARAETALIFSWARVPGLTIGTQAQAGAAWFVPWLTSINPLVWLIFIASTVLSLFNGVNLLIKNRIQHRSTYLLYLPIFTGLVFWFVTAPDIRFLGALLALFLALSVHITLKNRKPSNRVSRFFSTLSIKTSLGSFTFLIVVVMSLRYVGLTSVSWRGWSELKQVDVVNQTIATRQHVLTPAVGNQCWDAAIPCASLFNSELQKQTFRSHSVFSVQRP